MTFFFKCFRVVTVWKERTNYAPKVTKNRTL